MCILLQLIFEIEISTMPIETTITLTWIYQSTTTPSVKNLMKIPSC